MVPLLLSNSSTDQAESRLQPEITSSLSIFPALPHGPCFYTGFSCLGDICPEQMSRFYNFPVWLPDKTFFETDPVPFTCSRESVLMFLVKSSPGEEWHLLLQRKIVLWGKKWNRRSSSRNRYGRHHGSGMSKDFGDWWRGAGSMRSSSCPSAYSLPLYMSLLRFSMMLCVVLSKIVYMVRKIIAEVFPSLWNKVYRNQKNLPMKHWP